MVLRARPDRNRPEHPQAAASRDEEPTLVDHQRRRDGALISAVTSAIVARAVTAVVAIVSVALAARGLTDAGLGVFGVLTTLVVYLGFGDFGLGTLLMSRLPAAHARDERDEMRSLVSTTLSALCGIAVIVIVAGLLSVFLAPWQSILGAQSLGHTDVLLAVAMFVIFGAIGIPATIGSRVLAAMQRGAAVRFWSVVSALLGVVLVAICFVVGAPMWLFVAAMCGASTITGVVQVVWLIGHDYPWLSPDRSSMGLSTVLTFLRTSSPYALLSLGWVVAYCVDSLVVSSILGAASAAVFAIAARMFSLISSTISSAGQQMWPALSEAMARYDIGWVHSRFRRSVWATALISGAGCVVLVLAGQTLARIWVGASLVPSTPVLLVFAIWTVYFATMTQYSYILTAAEGVRELAIVGLVVAPVNLVVSIVLTRTIGLAGPVLGSLIAAVLVQVVPTVVLTRRTLSRLAAAPSPSSPVSRGHRGSTELDDQVVPG